MPSIALPNAQWNVQYMQRVLATDPIAYWMLDEKQGNVAYDVSRNEFHGAYTGVTLGQPGIGDGRTAPFFDGVNDHVGIYSAAFAALWDSGTLGDLGSLAIWHKVSGVGVWTDGTSRVRVGIGNGDYGAGDMLNIEKRTFNNQIAATYRTDGAAANLAEGGHSEITWVYEVLTWDRVADEIINYWQGTRNIGPTSFPAGAWDENVVANFCQIGAYSGHPWNPWHGWLAHCAIYDRALAPAEVADLAVV